MLTDDDKIAMARKFAAEHPDDFGESVELFAGGIVAFFDAAHAAGVREERERAVRICNWIEEGAYPNGDLAAGLAWECAAAIRAQGVESDGGETD